MTIDATCKKCETSFEIDVDDLLDGAAKFSCPHCSARAPAALVDDFVAALGEFLAQVRAMSKRFDVSLGVEPEDLDPDRTEVEDDESDDDELDFDEDDVDEDSDEEPEDEDFEDR